MSAPRALALALVVLGCGALWGVSLRRDSLFLTSLVSGSCAGHAWIMRAKTLGALR